MARSSVLPDLAGLGQHGRHFHGPELHDIVMGSAILRATPVPEVPRVEPCNPFLGLDLLKETIQLHRLDNILDNLIMAIMAV